MLLNPGQPLTTSNADMPHFSVQLTTQPASQVTLQFTSTNILAGTVTSSVIIDPTDWEQLPYVVAGHNDGFVSGSVESQSTSQHRPRLGVRRLAATRYLDHAPAQRRRSSPAHNSSSLALCQGLLSAG